MNCATCRFFQRAFRPEGGESMTDNGECRRNPPALCLVPGGDLHRQLGGVWPLVQALDWCGEYEPHDDAY